MIYFLHTLIHFIHLGYGYESRVVGALTPIQPSIGTSDQDGEVDTRLPRTYVDDLDDGDGLTFYIFD